VKTGTIDLMTGVITEDAEPNFTGFGAETSEGDIYARETPVKEPKKAKTKIRIREAAVEPQKKQGISLFSVVGFVLVAVTMIMMLMTNITLTEANDENVRLQEQLEALNEEGQKLDSEYKAAFNMTEVAEYAEKVLGMVKGSEDQVEYLDINSSDMAVVYKSAVEPKEESGFMSFLTSLVSYFK